MSYCRNNGKDSDVYLIATGNVNTNENGWECCGCPRVPREDSVFEGITIPGSPFFTTLQETIAHLEEHRRLGDKVPESAFERLRREIAEE
ncbi:hypothetical protein LCGC14_1497850 [marine sediment metagenome]|uniref:Uncharacterized protein n=1 Tax=marine sediment metagenome TaxID=412755 RepID=A0A0F9JQW5_9ZZZZ